MSNNKFKEIFQTKGGEPLSKFFIITFFAAAFNSLIFYIGFTIQDNKREIQQPFVLTQIIFSICLAVIFFVMFCLEKNHSLYKNSYGFLALLNLINFSILIAFYDYNKQNSEKDKDNSKKMQLFYVSYFFNLVIFGFSIFLCTRMFRDRNFVKC